MHLTGEEIQRDFLQGLGGVESLRDAFDLEERTVVSHAEGLLRSDEGCDSPGVDWGHTPGDILLNSANSGLGGVRLCNISQ
jgi:hypothetical protein